MQQVLSWKVQREFNCAAGSGTGRSAGVSFLLDGGIDGAERDCDPVLLRCGY